MCTSDYVLIVHVFIDMAGNLEDLRFNFDSDHSWCIVNQMLSENIRGQMGRCSWLRCQGDTWWYHGNHISSVLQLIKYCLATALEKQWNGKTKDALVWIMTGLKKDWKSNCQTNYIEISKLKIPNIFNSHSCTRNINDRGTDWDRTP